MLFKRQEHKSKKKYKTNIANLCNLPFYYKINDIIHSPLIDLVFEKKFTTRKVFKKESERKDK